MQIYIRNYRTLYTFLSLKCVTPTTTPTLDPGNKPPHSVTRGWLCVVTAASRGRGHGDRWQVLVEKTSEKSGGKFRMSWGRNAKKKEKENRKYAMM